MHEQYKIGIEVYRHTHSLKMELSLLTKQERTEVQVVERKRATKNEQQYQNNNKN